MIRPILDINIQWYKTSDNAIDAIQFVFLYCDTFDK